MSGTIVKNWAQMKKIVKLHGRKNYEQKDYFQLEEMVFRTYSGARI